jgi:hypothetical protein
MDVKPCQVVKYPGSFDIICQFHPSTFLKKILNQLEQMMNQVQQSQLDKDVWGYIWGNNQYSSSRFYSLNFKYIEAPAPFSWIWKAKITKKLKIFVSLVF